MIPSNQRNSVLICSVSCRTCKHCYTSSGITVTGFRSGTAHSLKFWTLSYYLIKIRKWKIRGIYHLRFEKLEVQTPIQKEYGAAALESLGTLSSQLNTAEKMQLQNSKEIFRTGMVTTTWAWAEWGHTSCRTLQGWSCCWVCGPAPAGCGHFPLPQLVLCSFRQFGTATRDFPFRSRPFKHKKGKELQQRSKTIVLKPLQFTKKAEGRLFLARSRDWTCFSFLSLHSGLTHAVQWHGWSKEGAKPCLQTRHPPNPPPWTRQVCLGDAVAILKYSRLVF